MEYQTNWDTRRAKGLPGMVVSEEKSNRISRTVESAAGLEFGQPAFRGTDDHGCVVGASFSATAAGSAAAGNTGDGAITASPTITAGAKEGRYVITMLEPGTNAGEFVVVDPDGVVVGNGTVAVAFSGGGVAFTIADGGTDFAAGDQFYVDTTFTANADYLGIAILHHLSQAALSSTPDRYAQYATAAIMTQGVIWGTAGATVADGDPVYWNPATKRYTNNAAHVRIPSAYFDTSSTDGNLVEIALRERN